MIVSAIALARELWRYGEDDLWPRALGLAPAEMVEIGERSGDLLGTKSNELWPDGPRGSRPVLLAGIEHLEGTIRPARLNVTRPDDTMPQELQISEAEG